MNLDITKRYKEIFSSQRITENGAALLSSTIAVLMYHDLSEDHDLSSWMRVKKQMFELQMRRLSEICHFIHPSDLFQKKDLSKDRLNILLTFDDGFVNQYTLALPILLKLKIPALFFISTENIESDIFWFDRILIPIQAMRIRALDLRSFGLRNYHFSSSDDAKRWKAIQVLLEDIKSRGTASSPNVRRIVEYFDNTFEDVIRRVKESYRPLTRDELRRMKATNLCYFGSHSHRHESLIYLNDDEVKKNVIESKEILEALLETGVIHFAYPNGDTDIRVSKLCQEGGYEYGYVTSSGLLEKDTLPMNIPRIAVGGYDSVQSLFWKINKELIRSILKLSI